MEWPSFAPEPTVARGAAWLAQVRGPWVQQMEEGLPVSHISKRLSPGSRRVWAHSLPGPEAGPSAGLHQNGVGHRAGDTD